MTRDFAVPDTPAFRASAQAWLAGPATPATPRLASTVMFLRDSARGIEVFMIHRVSSMAFAPSMHVFPGGGVDDRDVQPDLPWAGPSPAQWAAHMGNSEADARRLVVAAMREVFEETGVLLAAPTAQAPLVAPGPDWAQARAALVARELAFAQFLIERDLVLRTDLLAYRAHWTTPAFEPKRYDTRFFAARVPAGQAADDATSEAQSAGWMNPATVLAQFAAGEVLMLAPTIVALESLAAQPSTDAYFASAPDLREIMPELIMTDAGPTMRTIL